MYKHPMPIIKTLNGMTPQIHADVFTAETAVIIGDVCLASGVSVWYQAVLRGDVGAIRIGARSNIQDLCMIHCTRNYSETLIGEDVTVGHNAVLHGCRIEDRVLIGMGAIVMDKAVVQSDVIVAAGAVVLEGAVLESGFLYAGVPAKKLKPLSAAQVKSIHASAVHYLEYKTWYEG